MRNTYYLKEAIKEALSLSRLDEAVIKPRSTEYFKGKNGKEIAKNLIQLAKKYKFNYQNCCIVNTKGFTPLNSTKTVEEAVEDMLTSKDSYNSIEFLVTDSGNVKNFKSCCVATVWTVTSGEIFGASATFFEEDAGKEINFKFLERHWMKHGGGSFKKAIPVRM